MNPEEKFIASVTSGDRVMIAEDSGRNYYDRFFEKRCRIRKIKLKIYIYML